MSAPPALSGVSPTSPNALNNNENNNSADGSNNNNASSSATPSKNNTSSIVDPLVAALWGVIPIHAKLFPGDVKEGASPPDKQLLVPRQGFLIYHMDTLRAHFSPFASNIHSLWLSVKDKTGVHSYVPWHVPTHVIVDRVMTRQMQSNSNINNANGNGTSDVGVGAASTFDFDGSPVVGAGGSSPQDDINNQRRIRSSSTAVNNSNSAEARNWGTTFLPLVVYVHFTMPPALKKKQRPDLAASPDLMLTLKDTPGITTLHLHRWLKTVYISRFGDLVGFEGESREQKANGSVGWRMLKAAKDNDPLIFTSVKSDITKRQQNQTASLTGVGVGTAAGANSMMMSNNNFCVVVHTFDGKGDKPQFRYKICRVTPAGRSLGRMLPELLGPSFESSVPTQALMQDDVLPPNFGSVFVQGLQPLMSTPFDVLHDMFVSVDLALHLIWRPAAAR